MAEGNDERIPPMAEVAAIGQVVDDGIGEERWSTAGNGVRP